MPNIKYKKKDKEKIDWTEVYKKYHDKNGNQTKNNAEIAKILKVSDTAVRKNFKKIESSPKILNRVEEVRPNLEVTNLDVEKDSEKKLDPKIIEQVRYMVRAGLTQKEIAKMLEIGESTFYKWKDLYPELREVINENKPFVDSLVEDSLLKLALGFETTEKKYIYTRGAGEIKKMLVEEKTKTAAPDFNAARFWLTNRQKGRWAEKQTLEVNQTVVSEEEKEVIRKTLSGLSVEELRKLADLDEERNE